MSGNYFHKERDIYAIGSNDWIFICANLIVMIQFSIRSNATANQMRVVTWKIWKESF